MTLGFGPTLVLEAGEAVEVKSSDFDNIDCKSIINQIRHVRY